MKEQRPKTGRVGFKRGITGTDTIWSRLSARRIAATAATVPLLMALAACGASSGNDTAFQGTPTANGKVEMAAAASAASSTSVPLALSLKMNTTSITSDSQTDRFIIKYKTGTVERGSTSAVQSKLDKLAGTIPARAHHLRRLGIGADVVTTERKLTGQEAKAFMRAIAADPNVQYVEPDIAVSVSSVPNDPYFSSQWGLFSNQDPGQPYAGIRAANAWNVATGAGVTIGLIDNGITNHSDLNANISPGGFDFTFLPGPGDGTNPGRTVENPNCEVTFHGTHVAGILAAVTNNNIGISGVAPSSKVLSVRAFGACGVGSLSSIVEAMVWSAGGSVSGFVNNPRPVKVINASFATAGQCSRTYQDAIDYVNSLGATIVVAAGNDGSDASNSQPSNCHGVISVGNTQRDGTRYADSNYGSTVDIAAPGTDIYSTYNDGMSAVGAENYAYMTGTSMATPMVSGVVALVKSAAPKSLSAAEMRTLITQNAQPFPIQPAQPLGSGILDATAAVAAAKAGKFPAAADFSCSQSEAGMTVTCTDLSTSRGAASIKSWAWNFGAANQADMVSTQSTNPNYNYGYPGTYNITLTTTDSTGAISRLTRPFTVAPPVATAISPETHVTVPAQANVRKYFSLDVPAGTTYLRVAMSSLNSLATGTMSVTGGSPTAVGAACVQSYSDSTGGGAVCTMPNPTAGTYYIILSPNMDLKNADLYTTFKP